ncbi:MAG: hypothetical protein JWQ74_1077 [Marmoricola sp.]|nr:hypothetical protein [Marmoricola sp.]
MTTYQQMQHRHGSEAAEIAVDVDVEFAADLLAKMEANAATDADYLAGFRSVMEV